MNFGPQVNFKCVRFPATKSSDLCFRITFICSVARATDTETMQPRSQGLFPSHEKDPGNEVGKLWLLYRLRLRPLSTPEMRYCIDAQ